MALGFQDCCNSSSYFLLTGIPASVQEFETYYIQTLQGETFCAKYVELPKLNYSLPIYTLVTMTQQSDVNCPTYTVKVTSGVGCNLTYTNCPGSNQTVPAVLNSIHFIPAQENTISISPGCSFTILSQTPGLTACQKCTAESPCPAEQSIFLSQFGTGTIATSTDCYIKTIFPMVVNCNIDPPTSESTSDGTLGLYIIGGVAPYIAYEAGTHLTDNPTVYDVVPSSSPNTYTVRENLPEGTYSLTVTDSQGNFFVDVTCTLDAPPAPATVTCSGVPPSTSFEDDGSITINVAGGIPPYTLLNSNGVSIQTLANDGSITINNLTSGNYTYTLVETAQGSFQANQTTINCNVPAGASVTYPSTLCLSMLLCSQTGNENTFYLTLIQQGTFNNRPEYVLSSYSANIIGNPSGFKIQWGSDNVGWTSVAGTASSQPQFATPSSCSSSNNSFSLTSSYTAAGTIPLTALPQNFTWNKGSGYLTNLNATNISLSSNACPVNVFVSVSDSTICQNNVNSYATIILTANGGSGAPYSFFYRKGTTGSYTGPVTSPITIASSANAAGNYQVYSVDGSGTQSTTQTFTITNLCLSLTVTPSSPNICPNWEDQQGEDQQGVVTFTLTSSNSNSTGPYIFYWRKQSSPALQWNVISSADNTEQITVYGSDNGSPASSAGNNGFGIYEFYVESTNGDNSGIVISTLNDISCGPAPLSVGQKTVTHPNCAVNTGSVSFPVLGGTPPYIVSIILDGTSLPNQTFSTSPVTINNLVGGNYQIYVTDQTVNQQPIYVDLQINPISNIKFVAYTHINSSEKNNLINSNDFQLRNGARYEWNYPIDIEYYVEHPTGLGTLTGYLEVKLLTQRVFGPGLQGDGYTALNYGDGYYLGMDNWSEVTQQVTTNGAESITKPIRTWLPYITQDNSTWLMVYNNSYYEQPNTFPVNPISPSDSQLSNFTPDIIGSVGYYSNYAVNSKKTCPTSNPPYSTEATINSNFINFASTSSPVNNINNCPTKDLFNGTTCQEWMDFYDQQFLYVIDSYSEAVGYPPNFLEDTTYNSNGSTTFCNNPSTNSSTITWTAAAYPYILSLNGTLIVERTFTFGSQTSPITFNPAVTDGKIRVNYADFAIPSSVISTCDGWGLAFQIQVILHTVNSLNCPDNPSIPLPIEYYFQNGQDYLTDILPTPQNEYTASLKMVGNTTYPPETFQSTRIINDIGTPC